MPKPIHESGRLLEATPGAPATRRQIQIITPGWGSSGYYSTEVLQEAAANRVIPAGTHMYFNHASLSEREDRPERDVRDIAAVLVEDAAWDGTRLVAQADILGPHAELVGALAPHIGVSISGSATDITVGEAEGRRGPIIEGLADVASVDLVTHAGRGGRLLESARPSVVNALAVAHGVSEATVNDTRDALQNLVRDAHGGEKDHVWVRDFDGTTVWFEVESPTDSGLFAQAYSGVGSASALTGERTEVRVVTTYVPVTRPGSTNTTTTEESEEDTMPQIEESELARLREAHGRVPTLESERDTAIRERDEAIAERDRLATQEAARTRADRAAELIRTNEARTNAGVEFSALEARGLTAALPLTEAGALDEAAFTTAVNEAVTERLAGTGGITGFGGSQPIAEADFKAFEADFFGTKEA